MEREGRKQVLMRGSAGRGMAEIAAEDRGERANKRTDAHSVKSQNRALQTGCSYAPAASSAFTSAAHRRLSRRHQLVTGYALHASRRRANGGLVDAVTDAGAAWVGPAVKAAAEGHPQPTGRARS